ncbi:cobyrinate a,c-diamide synthase [Candidatus Magnetaquicoccus inordinatus]|uniref:cobyrinate a,c-diamide synthase n=1 Tax=Candidatus Magnetaquicoccus inordinatus TaxID=2496818 RepID=UPI00102D27A4|nr:cobyrinate a,c-diamide synthase [Candidatus Magnetaquicoccus inordinatus]
MKNPPGFLLAATQSHSGKTVVALALMARLCQEGYQIAPFKAGPDFIDPLWHSALCQKPSYSLDTQMMGREECRRLLQQHAPVGTLAIVEGAMGLYDGRQGVGGPGSSADLARTLNLPVILVINAKGMAGSLAALVSGFQHFAEDFTIVGIIANRVGSPSHARLLADTLQSCQLPPLLGWLSHSPELQLAERHLGLYLPHDHPLPPLPILQQAIQLQEESFRSLLPEPPGPAVATVSTPRSNSKRLLAGKRIAIARDAAFCFLYPANLDWLQEQGATLHFFSPLAGEAVPTSCQALWLPGGYPELHAASLAQSPTWLSLHQAAAQGLPILAECGGMMAIGQTLQDLEGKSWPMANLLPIHTRMTSKLAGLGYRQEISGAQGHEFHYSSRDPSALPAAFQVSRGDPGIRLGNIRASYIHWYFPSAPNSIASWLQGQS